MKRATVRLSIVLTTVVVGIGILSFWLATRCTLRPSHAVLADEVAAANDLINGGLQFKDPTFIDGTAFGEEFYEPQTDVGVAVISEGFSSPERVKAELRTRLRRAVTIFERGPKTDDSGRQVGERVVAMMSPCRSSKREAAIFWTQGNTLTTIEAPSLRYAIAFELSAK